MQKYALIREKRTLEIAKRMVRKNRRTFPPNSFQLNTIIAPMDIEPDIVEPIEEPMLEPILEPILVCISEANQPYEVEPVDLIPDIVEPIIEPILLIEKQANTENVLIEKEVLPQEIIIEDTPDIINPTLIAQAEELRKLILLQETIKRFSKKKI